VTPELETRAVVPHDIARADGELMAQIASGSTRAFEAIYDRYYARAYRVARSVCGDDGRAEEAVQEAFMSVWRNPANYQAERGELAAWLLRVVHHRAVDVARGNVRHTKRRADESSGLVRASPGVVADRVVDRDDAAHLNELLGRLPAAQREVIGLAFYGQLTHTEIARHLKLPSGTVKGRMRLGLGCLRTDMDEILASERWHTALAFAFYAGDFDEARRIVREASGYMPVVTMLDDVLAPAMHSIGALWQSNEITIADEHLATTICHRLLAEAALALQTAPPSTRETILLATPASEQHTFGLLMANDVLYGAGYKTILLGGGIPDEALAAALLRHQPAIVALSATMPSTGSFAATSTVVRETLPSAQLITGGAAAPRLPANITALHVGRLDGLLAAVDSVLSR